MADFPPLSLQPIAEEVVELLKARKETVSVAETAAGGLISASLLSIPGASAVYRGGATVYNLESRIAFGGWTEDTLKDYTGSTPEVLTALADYSRQTLGSTYAVSESGTAGPTGGPGKDRTPGFVALAVSTADGAETREIERGSDNRAENMVAFTEAALKLLKEVILSRSSKV
ncbi:competence/damage-inducible protein CinA [Aspergillus crustosus]